MCLELCPVRVALPSPQSQLKATYSTGDVTNTGKTQGFCVMVVVLRQKWPLKCRLPGCMGVGGGGV